MRMILASATILCVMTPVGAKAQQQMTVAIGPASAQPTVAKPAPPLPMVLMLLRSAVSAVSQGNAANNYEGLRALGTTAFQQNNSSQRLSAAFEALRGANLDLAPILITAPVLDAAPLMLPDGAMKVSGVFPTKPVEVPFTAIYAEEAGKWRLHGINVAVRPQGPTAVSASSGPDRQGAPASKASGAPAKK